MRAQRGGILLGLFLTLILSGCAKRPPAITEVEGVLLLNGQPLPMAQVDFMPELTNFGAEFNSTATTDEKGRFKLFCVNGATGAAVATHRVIVSEGAPPKELRGMGADSQTRLGDYMRKLSNRPIPAAYGNYSQTPLRVDVKPEQKEYVVNMTRPQ